jgi:hypothetical protein
LAKEFVMNYSEKNYEISAEARQAALQNPNGWVYKIEGTFAADEDVPPEAIVGAWKVNELGIITGDFLENPRYKKKI